MKTPEFHGMSDSREYRLWQSMINRCHSPDVTSYDNYGGRGITVCERWRNSFAAFMSDMGPRPTPDHTLDRKDNNLGYEPGNVVWADRKAQARNRTNNRWITYQGREVTLAELAETTGVGPSTIIRRLKRGDTVEEAIKPPFAQYTVGGRTQSLLAWSKEKQINYNALYHRVKVLGFSLEEAFKSLQNSK